MSFPDSDPQLADATESASGRLLMGGPVFDWIETTTGVGEPVWGEWRLQTIGGGPTRTATAVVFIEVRQRLLVPLTSVRMAHLAEGEGV